MHLIHFKSINIRLYSVVPCLILFLCLWLKTLMTAKILKIICNKCRSICAKCFFKRLHKSKIAWFKLVLYPNENVLYCIISNSSSLRPKQPMQPHTTHPTRKTDGSVCFWYLWTVRHIHSLNCLLVLLLGRICFCSILWLSSLSEGPKSHRASYTKGESQDSRRWLIWGRDFRDS